MDIEQPGTIRWRAPTTRTDSTPISGVLSYIVVVGDKRWTPSVPTITIDWQAEGFTPGSYTMNIYSQEEQGGRGRISAPAVFPFSLELVAPPNPPTNVEEV